MKKLLVLVDNEEASLNIMKELVEKNEKSSEIEILTLYKSPNESISDIIEKIGKYVPKTKREQAELSMHVVIDTCLTDEEHDMEILNENFSGIICLSNVSKMLIGTQCQYKLSLMTRFFAKQLKDLNKFNENTISNFYAIIRKPFLDSGEVDCGFSPMVQYADILPKEFLSRKYITAFTNVLIYALQGEVK